MTSSKDKPPHRLPPNITRELERRKIGNRYMYMYNGPLFI